MINKAKFMRATSTKLTKSSLYTSHAAITWDSSMALGLTLLSGLAARADLSGLVGYWPFNEGSGTITAEATNNNNGTLVGGPSWVASPIGSYGLSFGGGDDYVDVGDPASGILDFDETQSFSFGAWIKPAVVDGIGRRFISKIAGAENKGFALGLWNGSQGVFADVSDGTTELSAADFFDIPLTVGESSFVIAVVDRTESTLRVYVNGVEAEAAMDIFGLGSLTSATSLNFGRASGNSAKAFAGVLDEVRIYSRALSATDVQELLASMQTPLSFINQPMSQTVMEGQPVTFNCTFSGSPPYFLQWFSNAVAIAGATNPNYTIPNTTRGMNGCAYSITISNLLPSTITSTNATLTVVSDVTPPTLLAVFSRFSNPVVAVFSEPVSTGTAEAAANYVITNGAAQTVTVMSALLRANDNRIVTLTTATALAEGTDYVLVVSGVEDQAREPVYFQAQRGRRRLRTQRY
jgi:hypothetical protein